MVYCAVLGCSNNNNKRLKQNQIEVQKIRYFRFPRNKIRLNQWIHAIKRKDIFNINNAKVCSAHFCEEDYEICYRQQFLIGERTKGPPLKNYAVPHLNLPGSKSKDNVETSRTMRHKLKLHHEIIKQALEEYDNQKSSTIINTVNAEDNSANNVHIEFVKVKTEVNSTINSLTETEVDSSINFLNETEVDSTIHFLNESEVDSSIHPLTETEVDLTVNRPIETEAMSRYVIIWKHVNFKMDLSFLNYKRQCL